MCASGVCTGAGVLSATVSHLAERGVVAVDEVEACSKRSGACRQPHDMPGDQALQARY